jgi:hypothetical protein
VNAAAPAYVVTVMTGDYLPEAADGSGRPRTTTSPGWLTDTGAFRRIGSALHWVGDRVAVVGDDPAATANSAELPAEPGAVTVVAPLATADDVAVARRTLRRRQELADRLRDQQWLRRNRRCGRRPDSGPVRTDGRHRPPDGELRLLTLRVRGAVTTDPSVLSNPSRKDSPVKRMNLLKSLKRLAVGVLAASALTFGLPASPAFAINTVSCDGRTDFLRLVSWEGNLWPREHCFANAGAMAVNISGVTSAKSGNNKVTINYQCGSWYCSRTFGPWEGTDLGGARVYEVRIW